MYLTVNQIIPRTLVVSKAQRRHVVQGNRESSWDRHPISFEKQYYKVKARRRANEVYVGLLLLVLGFSRLKCHPHN